MASEEGVKNAMTPEQANELLADLADPDDKKGIRSRFAEEPVALLAEYGVEVSPDLIPAEVSAPKPEAAKAALRTIQDKDFLGLIFRPPICDPPAHSVVLWALLLCFAHLKAQEKSTSA